MLKNYFKIALRNLFKNKIDSAISISGLAAGIACCILLVLFVRLELSYNNFHKNKDNIFRIYNERHDSFSGTIRKSPVNSFLLGGEVKASFPEIKAVVRLAQREIQYKEKEKFFSQTALFADENFFDLFSFRLTEGSKKNVLSTPNSIVISEGFAQSVFGNTSSIGKVLTLRMNGNEHYYTVSGIAKEVPKNSSLSFDIVLPVESVFLTENEESAKQLRESWFVGSFQTWVLLNSKTEKTALEAKFPQFVETHYGAMARRMKQVMKLQPLTEVYFNNGIGGYLFKTGNRLYTFILGGIALVILAIAGINFISLTLSRAANRANEIGIRVTSGAEKKHISQQFFGEVFITCFIAFLIGIVLSELLVPYFQQAIQKPISVGLLQDPLLWIVLGGLLVLITLITGSYPALAIPRLQKSGIGTTGRSAQKTPLIVKTLIVIQFGLSIGFLIFTVTMQQQFQYMLTKDLGYEPEQIISISLDENSDILKKNAAEFARQARLMTSVSNASVSASYFSKYVESGLASMMSATNLEGFPNNGIVVEAADEHFINTMGIKIFEGENFTSDKLSDIKKGVIINKTFAEYAGWENPVGKVIEDKSKNFNGPYDGYKVLAVVEDFHYASFFNSIDPMLITHIENKDYNEPSTIYVKTSNANFSETINDLRLLWNDLFPSEVFEYHFMNNLLQRQYEDEQRWNLIMKLATGISILLACFGLFGLASLASQRRNKEISIRKVMGASVANLVQLLTKDFIKLVVIGFVLAVPAAYYFVDKWLQAFTYKIDLGVEIFLVAGISALAIAVFTISWQSVKAALQNPVENLRNE